MKNSEDEIRRLHDEQINEPQKHTNNPKHPHHPRLLPGETRSENRYMLTIIGIPISIIRKNKTCSEPKVGRSQIDLSRELQKYFDWIDIIISV